MSEQPPPPRNRDQFINPQQPPQGQPPLPPPMYQYPPQDAYGPRERVYAPPRKKHNGVWIALAVVFVVGVVLCGVVGMASSGTRSVATDTTSTSAPASSNTPAATGKWTTTHTYSGNGAKKTEIITMPDDWKISYTCRGMNVDGVTSSAVFQVYVYDQSGNIQDVAVNELCASRGTTSGTTEEHQGGQVYLDVNADSAWTLKVQEQQ